MLTIRKPSKPGGRTLAGVSLKISLSLTVIFAGAPEPEPDSHAAGEARRLLPPVPAAPPEIFLEIPSGRGSPR
jgi:hypothetical protein